MFINRYRVLYFSYLSELFHMTTLAQYYLTRIIVWAAFTSHLITMGHRGTIDQPKWQNKR